MMTPRIYLTYCLERDTLIRSIKVALVVGTILGVINHYPAIVAWSIPLPEAIQITLTYLVPFSVATYSQVMGKRQRDLERTSR